MRSVPDLFAKNCCDAWTNALQRQLRNIKSRYGIYAIFYGSFMHILSCAGSPATPSDMASWSAVNSKADIWQTYRHVRLVA
jgi:hypothetical protein